MGCAGLSAFLVRFLGSFGDSACVYRDSAYIQFMNPIRSGWGANCARKKRGGFDIFLTRNKITFNIKLVLI
jgi:hypothetical protein